MSEKIKNSYNVVLVKKTQRNGLIRDWNYCNDFIQYEISYLGVNY